MSSSDKLDKLLEWALVKLLTDSPLYGAMATSFPVISHDLPEGILACTNGSVIAVARNRPQITNKNILALLAHEINHIMFHHTRPMARPSFPVVWRYAQEIEAEMYVPSSFGFINDYLRKEVDHFKNLQLDSCESIYLWLIKHTKKITITTLDGKTMEIIDLLIQEGQDGDPGAEGKKPGGLQNGPPHSLVTLKVLQALKMAEGMGSIPSTLLHKLEALRKPRISWRSFLREYWGTKVGAWDLEVTKLSPVYWNTIRLPVPPLCVTHGSPDVLLVIDTSGSMVGAPLNAVVSEIRGLSGVTSDVRVLIGDAEIHEVVTLAEVNDEEISALCKKLKGCGGTDFRPAFSYVKEKGLRPQLVCYLTDCWGTFPEEVPSYPVVWLTPHLQEEKVPFGTVIHIPPESYT